ncbi:MAG TPA: hypothetical protein VLR89_05860 [Anaerolineaceae bacterium]|nr:hypothetical protein [Anaerolineaceae bacterium]
METLEIGTHSLNGSQYWVQVLGEGRHPLITSAKYLRRISDQPVVAEELLLFFRGSPAELEGVLRAFQNLVAVTSSTFAGLPQLALKTTVDSEAYFSQILEAQLEESLESVENTAMDTLRLKILFKRLQICNSAEVELPLTLPGGSSQTGGVTLYNHEDLHTGHHGSAVVNTAVLNTNLAVALRAEVTNNYNAGALGNFRLGLLVSSVTGYFPKLDFEAETGSLLTPIASATDSGDAYIQPSWAGNDWTSLFTYQISDLDLAILNQTSLLPILRFSTRPADTSLQFRLRASVNDSLHFLTGAGGLQGQGNLATLPAVRLNQSALPGVELPSGLLLELQAISSEAGSHTVALDSLRLFPQAGFANFTSLGGLPYGAKLIDQPDRGLAWSRVGGHELQSHNRFGSDFLIPAGSYGKLFIMGEALSGQAEIERTYLVRVWGSKRRQIL